MQKFIANSDVSIIRADCRSIIERLPQNECAIVTDPPYGIRNNCDYSQMTYNRRAKKNTGIRYRDAKDFIEDDEHAFDPRPWLGYPFVVLWGANHFAQHLTRGQWLVWIKKNDNMLGKCLSDCELAWVNKRNATGVFAFKHYWNGACRESERHTSFHPNQKPVALHRWVLERVPEHLTIVDPYAGSASIGVACASMGRKYIGCEIDPEYFAVAKSRLKDAVAVA